MAAAAVTIKIRNLMGVEFADIVGLSSIALVAGNNRQGKSSLLEAAAAVLCYEPKMRDVTRKTDLLDLVRDGAKFGEALIRVSDNAAHLHWPSEEYVSEGIPPTAAPYACGMTHIAEMDGKSRGKILLDVLQAIPTEADYRRCLADTGDIAEAKLDAVAAKTWAEIQRSGWDQYLSDLRGKANRLKGKWEGITGEAWGPKKYKSWVPHGWSDELASRGESDLREHVRVANEVIEKRIAAMGVDEGRLQYLREQAEKVPKLEKLLIDLKASKEKLDEHVVARKETLDNLPPYHSIEPKPCPKCRAPLVPSWAIMLPGQAGYADAREHEDLILAAGFGLDERKAAERTAERDKLEQEIIRINSQIQEMTRAATDRTAELNLARNARNDLERAESTKVTKEDVDAARLKQVEEQRSLDLFLKKKTADAEAAALAVNQAVVQVVKPDGCRGIVLRRRLEDFNLRLAKLSEMAGFALHKVNIDAELDVRLGSRRFSLLSGSERLMVNAVMTAALGQVMQAPLLLIDEIETLEPQWRPAVFRLLRYAGVPAIVVSMWKTRDEVPDLSKLRVGRSFWMQAGRLEELTDDQEG